MIQYYSKVTKTLLLHTISDALGAGADRVELTPTTSPVQVSRIRFASGKVVTPHSHGKKSSEYADVDPPECWIVVKGRLSVSLFDIDRALIAKAVLAPGSALITSAGGHSIDQSEGDAEIIEVKMGPYLGNDKLSFEAKHVQE